MMSNNYSVFKKLIPYQFNGIDLIRIGRNMDGGYLVPKNTIEDCDAFISGGISNDISFEQSLLEYNLTNLLFRPQHREIT